MALASTHASLGSAVDSSFTPDLPDGAAVEAMVAFDDGIVVGGDFKHLNEVDRPYLARLSRDGTLDMNFAIDGRPDGPVRQIAVESSGAMIIAGAFRTFRGIERAQIARIESDGTVDPSFRLPGYFNGRIQAIAVRPNGKVIVGGDFSALGGVNRIYLLQLNVDGSVDEGFEPRVLPSLAIEGGVTAVALQSDGGLLVGGVFRTATGPKTVVRLMQDGSIDPVFGAGETGPILYVRCLAVQADGNVLLGGLKSSAGAGLLLRLDLNGSIDPGFHTPSIAGGGVDCISVQTDGRIVLGGTFNTLDGVERNGLARVQRDGTLDFTFNHSVQGVSPAVQALAAQGSDVLVGGRFAAIDSLSREGLARIQSTQQSLRLSAVACVGPGQFRMRTSGWNPAGQRLEFSLDLKVWQQVDDCQFQGLTIDASMGSASSHGFFRAVPQ